VSNKNESRITKVVPSYPAKRISETCLLVADIFGRSGWLGVDRRQKTHQSVAADLYGIRNAIVIEKQHIAVLPPREFMREVVNETMEIQPCGGWVTKEPVDEYYCRFDSGRV
jgi:hypothetical protein